MGHFILVEKDASQMQKCWKWVIIGLLIVIVATCFATSFAFNALQKNFNSNCMSSATLVFKPTGTKRFAFGPVNNNNQPNSTDDSSKKMNELLKEFNSYYQSETNNGTDEFTSADLYEYLNNGPSIFRTTTERSNLTVEEKDFLNLKDADFFKNQQIDEMYTSWGNVGTCEYFFFIPIVEAICAVVWIVLIVISGHRSEQVARSFIHKAWRLVVPAVVFFTVLAILSAVDALVLNSRLNGFSDEFKSKFNNKALPGQLLLNRYSLYEDTAWSPGANFVMCKFFSWLTVVLWLLAVMVMLARCILGADFNIEEVENYEEAYGGEVDPETEQLDTRVKFNDYVRRYSHEKNYLPPKTKKSDPEVNATDK